MRALLVVAVAVAIPPALPAAAQQPDPDEPDRLTLVEQTPWVAPGATFSLQVHVERPPRNAELEVTVHDEVRTRIEFERGLDGTGLRRRLGSPVRIDVERAGVVTVDVPGDIVGATGVFPVAVELVDGDGDTVDRLVTHLLSLPEPDPDDELQPLAVAVLLPLHAPPAHRSPSDIDGDAADRLAVTVDALADHPDVSLTLVPSPETMSAVAATDPALAERLREVAAGRQVLAPPWARLDPGAWTRSDLDDELDRQLERGADAVRSVLGDADEQTWLLGAASPAAVAAAEDRGVRTVVVQEEDLAPLDDDFPLTLTRPFRLPTSADPDEDTETVAGVMADGMLAAHVGSTGDAVLDAHRLLADLAVLAGDEPVNRRVAVVLLPDTANDDREFLEALLRGLEPPEAPPVVQPPPGEPPGPAETPPVPPPAPPEPEPLLVAQTLADAVQDVEPAGADGGADEDDPLVRTFANGDPPRVTESIVDALTEARTGLATYRSVFGPGDPVAAAAEDVVLTAGTAALSGGERRALLGSASAALAEELAGLHGPGDQRVTLTAREGQVQLVLTNETDRPADVVLRLRGGRLEFPGHGNGRVPVHLQAATTTRVELSVRARSSGDARLDLVVMTPDGRRELGRSSLTVRTTAVSGVGLVLLGAAAAFLVVWWTRTILRDRRAARGTPAHARP